MTIFNELYSNQYDHLYAEKNYQGECDLIEAAIKRYGNSTPSALLDIGCGTGSHAIELAQRGYYVTGIDLSQPMLDCAMQKASLMKLIHQPTWLNGDARDFDTGLTFDLGIMMFAVIGYFTTNDDVLNGLRNIRRQLKPGALFICDFWYGPSVLSTRPTDRVRLINTPGGRVVRAASTTLDVVRHTADVTINIWSLANNRLIGESRETHRLRYFFPQEFALMLSAAEFKLCGISAFPSLDNPLADDTWNALAVAQAI